jgi:hypothetical protein
MNYFDITYRKNLRKELVNMIYNQLIKTGYPPNILAFIIKAYHLTIPFITIVIYLFAPLQLSYILCGVLFIFLILYIYLQGCFISHLEYKLHNKDFINIADPMLVLFNYPINKENQYLATLYATIIYFIIVFFILYMRNIIGKIE